MILQQLGIFGWKEADENLMFASLLTGAPLLLIGRFAFFLYSPDVLQMDEEDRIRVAMHINGDDAPSLSEWTSGKTAGTVSAGAVAENGEKIRAMLRFAGAQFLKEIKGQPFMIRLPPYMLFMLQHVSPRRVFMPAHMLRHEQHTDALIPPRNAGGRWLGNFGAIGSPAYYWC